LGGDSTGIGVLILKAHIQLQTIVVSFVARIRAALVQEVG